MTARLLRRAGWPLACVPVPTGRRIGVEQELRVEHRGAQVDFRTLLQTLVGDVRPLDPGDPRARRLETGVALTADGWEAELATPPVAVGADAARTLDGLLRHERARLHRELDLLMPGVQLSGFSTHVNVSVPDEVVVEVGRDLVRGCIAGLMLLVEGPATAGVLVRPRRGRLEVGTDYLEGEALSAALTYVSACVRQLDLGEPPPCVPEVRAVPSREKFGWFVDPSALGLQLSGEVRHQQLITEDGSSSAQDVLRTLWDWARPAALDVGMDPGAVDRLVSGDTPLPSEQEPAGGDRPCSTTFVGETPRAAPVDTSPRAIGEHYVAETAWVCWDAVAWSVADLASGRTVTAVIEPRQEEAFLRDLESGRHDQSIRTALRRRWPRRLLLTHSDLMPATLWHGVRPGALVPAERRDDGTPPVVRPPRWRPGVEERA